MKKILIALFIGTATLATTLSCTKEYVTNYLPSQTIIFERQASDWEGQDNQMHLVLPVPELTDYYMQQGVVTVAYSYDNEGTYHAIGTKEGVAYSYEYSVGSVTITAQDPILEDDIFVDVPSQLFVKVTLTDADWIE